jgi:hypothetical protein
MKQKPDYEESGIETRKIDTPSRRDSMDRYGAIIKNAAGFECMIDRAFEMEPSTSGGPEIKPSLSFFHQE